MIEGKPILILFIEDDPAHAEIIIRNFEKNKLINEIKHISDGQQALNYLYRLEEYSDPSNSPRPDLILLDLRLPKVDGIEVLESIKKDPELKTIPVIILTTSSSAFDIDKSYKNYVNSYLVKPLDFGKFSDLLESFGFYWLVWNKLPSNMDSRK